MTGATRHDPMADLIDALAEALVEEYLTAAASTGAGEPGTRAEHPVASFGEAA